VKYTSTFEYRSTRTKIGFFEGTHTRRLSTVLDSITGSNSM